MTAFGVNAPPGARWRALAEQKLAEIDVLITRAQGMKRLLEEGIRCQSLNLDESIPLAVNADFQPAECV